MYAATYRLAGADFDLLFDEHERVSEASTGAEYMLGWPFSKVEYQVLRRGGERMQFRVRNPILGPQLPPAGTRTSRPGRRGANQPTSAVRDEVHLRDADRCRYCGCGPSPQNWLECDHVDPLGPGTAENLVLACRRCNLRKGSRTPQQWKDDDHAEARHGPPEDWWEWPLDKLFAGRCSS